jgi:hypothetical protein
MTGTAEGPGRALTGTLTGIGIVIGIVVAALTSDVIIGVIAGAGFIAVSVGLARLWFGGGSPRPHHP